MTRRERQARVVNPGPVDPSVLRLQTRHISQHIWNGDAQNRNLEPRRCTFEHVNGGNPPPALIPYLMRAGFYGVSRLVPFEFESVIVSALIERWRPETHTFHMPHGECTITLQDVSILLGLPCDGLPVIGKTKDNYRQWCRQLLGVVPGAGDITGQRVSMQWLTNTFGQIPPNATEEQLERCTRAYILRLIGAWLICDKSAKDVHLMYLPFLEDIDRCGTYCWGGAILAFLFREMCNCTNVNQKEISGCLSLLLMWAWERFPRIAPKMKNNSDPLQALNHPLPPLGRRWGRVHQESKPSAMVILHYRQYFDTLDHTDFLWTPYNHSGELIPEYCMRNQQMWRSSCPLICMHIIEWHHPDRVLRQFGMDQLLPHPPMDLDHVHRITLRGRIDNDWEFEHHEWLGRWDRRYQTVSRLPLRDEPLHRNSPYMQWYKSVTRRWIDPRSASSGYVVDKLDDLRDKITEMADSGLVTPQYVEFFIEQIANMQLALGEPNNHFTEQIQAPRPPEVPRPEIQPNPPRQR